jgi:hypothetical protein
VGGADEDGGPADEDADEQAEEEGEEEGGGGAAGGGLATVVRVARVALTDANFHADARNPHGHAHVFFTLQVDAEVRLQPDPSAAAGSAGGGRGGRQAAAWAVQKRFTEVAGWHDALAAAFPKHCLPRLPVRRLFGNNSAAVMLARKVALCYTALGQDRHHHPRCGSLAAVCQHGRKK